MNVLRDENRPAIPLTAAASGAAKRGSLQGTFQPLEQKFTRGMAPILALSVSGVFLDGFDISIMAVALLSVAAQFHPSPLETGLVVGSVIAGNFVGAIVFGHLADRIGRRQTFLYDMFFFVVFALLSAFAQNIYQLALWRFLLGVGIGADYALASPILAEIVPSRVRGRLMVANWSGAFITGQLFSFGVALLILWTGFGGENAWRWMLASGAVPAMVILLARRSFPESPRWLKAQGRVDEAEAVVRAVSSGAPMPQKDYGPALPVRTTNHLRELFGPRYRSRTIFATLNYFLITLPFWSISLFLPLILKISGFATSQTSLAAGNLLIQSASLLGVAACFFLVDTAGRKFVNYLGYIIAGIAIAVTMWVDFPPSPVAMVVLFAAILIGLLSGPASVNNIYLGELWPANVKGTGAGIAVAAGRISAVFATFASPSIIATYGVRGALVLPLVFCLLGILNTALFGVETKQRSLEEIESD